MTDEAFRPPSLTSIILVVRNGERFIAAALQSVVDQNYTPKEILVIDGHSDDGTADIARAFPRCA